MFYSCEGLTGDYDNGIDIKNNSNIPIGFYFADGYEFLGEGTVTAYPDTLLPQKNKMITYYISGNMRPGIGMPNKKSEFLKYLPKDTLSIFIFHTDTLNKYSWEEVRNGYKILKRYDLSYKDLEKLQFKIPYPPSPGMAKMKIYPKYP